MVDIVYLYKVILRRFIIVFIAFLVLPACYGQRVIKPKLIEVDWKGIIYKKEKSFDLRLHENGAAIAYNTATIKTYNRTNYYHIELGYTKDEREKTQSKISQQGRSGSYAFGKINSLINVRAGAGIKKYLSEKEKKNGLAVGYTYEIGPSLAVLKPYYLDLIYVETFNEQQVFSIRSEKYSEQNANLFLNDALVSDRSSFFKGFNELTVKAGIQGKLGLHLAMGAFDEYVKAFETGVMFDMYVSKIPILLETENSPNKRFFFRLYLNFQFGKRTN